MSAAPPPVTLLLPGRVGIGGGGMSELADGEPPKAPQQGAEWATAAMLTSRCGGAIGKGAEEAELRGRGGGGGMANGEELCTAGDAADGEAWSTMMVWGLLLLLPGAICSPWCTLFASRIFCTAFARIAQT